LQVGHNAATGAATEAARVPDGPPSRLLADRGRGKLAEQPAYRIGSGSAPTVWKATRIGR
jgi:hypothetical protein